MCYLTETSEVLGAAQRNVNSRTNRHIRCRLTESARCARSGHGSGRYGCSCSWFSGRADSLARLPVQYILTVQDELVLEAFIVSRRRTRERTRDSKEEGRGRHGSATRSRCLVLFNASIYYLRCSSYVLVYISTLPYVQHRTILLPNMPPFHPCCGTQTYASQHLEFDPPSGHLSRT